MFSSIESSKGMAISMFRVSDGPHGVDAASRVNRSAASITGAEYSPLVSDGLQLR
jgi:hypothetical protein